MTVELAFDDDYRSGPAQPMPSWFREALNEHRTAAQTWSALTPSRQKEILRYFAGLKTPAARSRNVRRAIQVLSGRKGRFMARSWNG